MGDDPAVGAEQAIRFLRTTLSLQRRKATGVLEVVSGDDRARLSFSRGNLVFVEHKSLGRTLGAYLIERGLLTRAQYEEVADELRGTSHPSPMMAFVEAAVSRGILDVQYASSIVQSQVDRNFALLLEQSRFECSFAADEEAVTRLPRFECQLEALVLQAIRRRFASSAAPTPLERRGSQYPRLIAKPADVVAAFRLQPEELRVVRRIDGETTLDGLLAARELRPDATRWVLLALHLAKQIEWADAPGADRDEMDSGEGFVVPPAVQRRRVASVRMTLPTPPSDTEIEAASAFRRGVTLYREGKLAEARDALTKATGVIDHPEYALYRAWVEAGGDNERKDLPTLQKLADAARRALEHDATMSFGYYVVGHLHLAQDDAVGAEVAFRRAAKLDPTDRRAAEHAERLRAARHRRR